MNDVRDLTRASKDFSRGIRAREPEDLVGFRVTKRPPSLRRPLALAFLGIVILPALLRFLFLAIFISPQFESAATFVLRGDTERTASSQSGGLLGGVAGTVSSTTRTQEAGILARLLPNRAFVERLGTKLDLAGFYTSEAIDSYSRLAPNASPSALAGYWRSMSSLSIDPLGGILTLKVRAFAPDDARRIGEAVLEVSEETLNALLESSRHDALRIAEQDKQRAGEDLEALRREIESFRRQSGMLNPQTAGSSALELILSRRAQRAALAAELQATLASLSPQSAQVRALKARIAALDEQIAALEEDLAKGGDSEAIAGLISTYEELELKRAFAEQTFTLAEMTLLRTQAEVERWHIYLIPVTAPDTPIESVEPRPFAEAAHVFLIALVIWGIVSLLALGTAEHRQ